MSRYAIIDLDEFWEVTTEIHLPDAEHIHLTITNGTITAVPMTQVPRAGWEDGSIVQSLTGPLRPRPTITPLWVDAPGETPS